MKSEEWGWEGIEEDGDMMKSEEGGGMGQKTEKW